MASSLLTTCHRSTACSRIPDNGEAPRFDVEILIKVALWKIVADHFIPDEFEMLIKHCLPE